MLRIEVDLALPLLSVGKVVFYPVPAGAMSFLVTPNHAVAWPPGTTSPRGSEPGVTCLAFSREDNEVHSVFPTVYS